MRKPTSSLATSKEIVSSRLREVVVPLQGDIIVAFQYLKETCRKDVEELFNRECSDRIEEQ